MLVLFAVSCSSPEKKANALIKTYMQTEIIDMSQYEPLSSIIEPAKNLIVYQPEYQKAYNKCRSITGDLSIQKMDMEGSVKMRDIYADDLKYSWGRRHYDEYNKEVKEKKAECEKTYAKLFEVLDSMDNIIKTTNEEEDLGWKVIHNYKLGGIPTRTIYIFDKDMTRIINCLDPDDLQTMIDELDEAKKSLAELPQMKAAFEDFKNRTL